MALGKGLFAQIIPNFRVTKEEEIMGSMCLLANYGLRVEPTGALSVAAGIRYLTANPKRVVGCTYHNMHF